MQGRGELYAGLLAQAFDAAPNGFVLANAQGGIVAANRELCLMFGYEREAMLQMNVDQLLPPQLRDAHVQHRQGYLQAPEPSMRSMGVGRRVYARHAKGHEFPIEVALRPLTVPDGERLVLASVVDVSERQSLQSAFEGVFDASPYGLMLVNDAGNILHHNKVLAKTLGYEGNALTGQSLSVLLPQRYREGHSALMRGYVADARPRMMGAGRDLAALHADGTEVPVEIGLSRVWWKSESLTLVVVTDIRERKRMEQELKQANANLQEFTYVASHDLRSPLRGISDLLEWIGEDAAQGRHDEVARNLARAAERVHRMEALIDDLLQYARAGRAETRYEEVDLGELIEGILALDPVPVSFTLEKVINVPPVKAFKTPLETVLRNLISNAIKHHDAGTGRVRVAAEVQGENLLITVSDDGPGVPKAAAERIFKLFQTLTASRRGSTGIGLSVCKRMVEVHGGRIDVVSPVQGERGAMFRVWWPAFPRRLTDE